MYRIRISNTLYKTCTVITYTYMYVCIGMHVCLRTHIFTHIFCRSAQNILCATHSNDKKVSILTVTVCLHV